jgi:hypothetical protein
MNPATQFGALKLDASESAFLSRQLEQIRAQTYDIKLQALKGRDLVPVDNSVSPGAEVVTYRQFEPIGLAKIISNYADDLPRADVIAREFTSKIRGIGASYGYSVQEIRAAQFAGVPLEQRKANAARRAIEEKIDLIIKTGDSQNGLLGLLNQTNTTAFTVPAGAATTTPWTTKTPDEVVKDLHGIANGIVSSTKEVETPDTLLLPLAQYTLIATKRMGDGSDATILKFFLSTSPFIKNVIPWAPLAGAGAAGADRMVCYRRDPDALQVVISQEFEQFPPQTEGLEVVTACHARCGGVVVYYPLSISYGDGI